MDITFLGSGDAFGSGGRLQSCMLLETDSSKTLLDCGTTALLGMQRAGVDPNAIDTVLLSHFHGDHFGGVPYLILEGQFRQRTRPLVIAGPPGVAKRVHEMMELSFPGSSQTRQRFDVSFRELGREGLELADLKVSAIPVVHTPGAEGMGLRVGVGAALLAYTGDSEWTSALTDLAEDADLLIAESYSFEKTIPWHLSYATIRAKRAELPAKRLLLTHVGPEVLIHHREVVEDVAEDGRRVRL